jgi:hypothetical protein
MLNRQAIFSLFSLTLVVLLVVPNLVQHGMFMDGVQYACVSKNLAFGKGTFWLPYLSAAWEKEHVNYFLEHPPLTYFLQSIFFRFLGDTVFAEKFYCFVMVIICAILIRAIWRLLFEQDSVLKSYWWLAMLLWFITPSVFWSYSNNMIENTVSAMVLAASYFSLKIVYRPSFKILNLLLAAIFVLLGSLCKGLPALFPLSLFFSFYFATKHITLKKTIIYTSVLLLLPLTFYLIVYYTNSEANYSLRFYVENRLLKRITDNHTVDNRFTILFWLFTDLLVNIALSVVLILVFKLKNFTKLLSKSDYQFILFFLAYGLFGVLPLCLTHVQRATYFVPAIPFFAMAFALFFARGLHVYIERLSDAIFKKLSVFVYAFSFSCLIVCVCFIGQTSRDHLLLEDVNKIGKTIGRNKLIGAPFEIYNTWDFQFYLLRYFEDELISSKNNAEDYLIFKKANSPKTIANYSKQNLALNDYVLFIKTNRSASTRP